MDAAFVIRVRLEFVIDDRLKDKGGLTIRIDGCAVAEFFEVVDRCFIGLVEGLQSLLV